MYIYMLVASAFGPYLSGSFFYTGTILPYLLGSILVLRQKKFTVHKILRPIISLMVINLFWILFVNFLNSGFDQSNLPKVFSGAEKIMLPIVIGIVVSVALEFDSILLKISTLVIFLVLINSILVFVQLITGEDWFISIFIPSNSEINVWELSATNGRLNGIFNQPIESGVIYTIATLLNLFILSNKSSKSSWLFGITLLLNLFGGIFSVSKAFFPLGVLIALAYAIYEFRSEIKIRKIFNLPVLVAMIPLSIFAGVLVENWGGLNYFLRLIDIQSDTNFVELFSGGRSGNADSQSAEYFASLVSSFNVFFGFGYVKFDAVDNGLLAMLSVGGIVASLSYLFIFLYTVRFSLINFRFSESKILFLIAIFLFLTNIGAPVMYLNRANIICWAVCFIFSTEIYNKIGREDAENINT